MQVHSASKKGAQLYSYRSFLTRLSRSPRGGLWSERNISVTDQTVTVNSIAQRTPTNYSAFDTRYPHASSRRSLPTASSFYGRYGRHGLAVSAPQLREPNNGASINLPLPEHQALLLLLDDTCSLTSSVTLACNLKSLTSLVSQHANFKGTIFGKVKRQSDVTKCSTEADFQIRRSDCLKP